MLTCGIKHWGLGGYSSILPRIKFGVIRQESSPQSPTISYRRPLCLIVESRRTFKHIWFLPTQKAQTKNQKSLNFANAQ